jgi:hypothetical protein
VIPEELAGVVIAPVISAIIEALKAAGMPTRYADLANVVLSGIAIAGAYALDLYPESTPWVTLGLQVVVTILMASGFYGVAIKRAKNLTT